MIIVKGLVSLEVSAEKFNSIKELLQKEGVINVRIRGSSMRPLLSELDLVKIFPIENYHSLKRFDVIVFWQQDILMCHYFWNKNKVFNSSTFLTRPLNPISGYDHPIDQSQILGVARQLKIGQWLKWRIIYHCLFR